MNQRFKLEGIVYEIGSQSDVTLRDFILLEQETRDLGQVFTMGDIVQLADQFKELTPDQSKVHPQGHWMLAATIWIAMVRKARLAGDMSPIPFADAIDANLGTFEQLPDPSDRKAPAGKGKKRPAAKKAASKAATHTAPADVDEADPTSEV